MFFANHWSRSWCVQKIFFICFYIFILTDNLVGLTLTAATRVIVFDPSWNPSIDDQSVDRAYRIGQKKPVVVFRLITCDTIEEKIYRRQIFKKSVINQNNGENDDPIRHFDSAGIRQLFGEPLSPERSETQEMLEFLKEKRKTYPKLDELLKKLENISESHAGVHDHDLVFDPENEALVMEALDQEKLNTTIISTVRRFHGEPGPSGISQFLRLPGYESQEPKGKTIGVSKMIGIVIF